MNIVYVLEAMVILYLGIGLLIFLFYCKTFNKLVNESIEKCGIESKCVKGILIVTEWLMALIFAVCGWILLFKRGEN